MTHSAVVSPDLLSALARACDAWRDGCSAFEQAVRATALQLDLPEGEVRAQLRHVAHWDETTLCDVYERDCRAGDPPRVVLHIAAGGVPGLPIESLILALVAGASEHIVRISRVDVATALFVQHLLRYTRESSQSITITCTRDVAWERADAAVVYGRDDTIELVRTRLQQGARVIAFGERTGLAVVTRSGIDTNEGWAQGLADDMLRFNARGCMSPREVIFAMPGDDAQRAQTTLAAAMQEHAAERNRARPLTLRRLRDAAALGITENTVTEAAFRARTMPTLSGISEYVARQLYTLQTVVAVASESERSELIGELQPHGATRICQVGHAHTPPRDGMHEGIRVCAALRGEAGDGR